MNRELYWALTQYLSTFKVPENTTQTVKRETEKIASGYLLDNGILYKKHKGKKLLVIPEQKLNQILKATHDHPLAGHAGINNTISRLKEKYYWKTMYKDINNYIKTCDICQKRRLEKETEELKPIRPPTAFSKIGIDIIGPLPRTLRGNRYIIMAIDYLTKWVEAKPLQLADALSIAPFIYEDIICRHGIPVELTSDRGTEFLNELIKTLVKEYKIKHITTTAYHPQANGLVERANQTMKNILAKTLQQQKGDWDLYVSSALFTIRTMKQQSTRMTPFQLTYGREPRQIIDQILMPEIAQDYQQQMEIRINQEIDNLKKIRIKAQDFISQAQERQKKKYDSDHKEITPLKIGDEVLLYRNVVEASWSAKLEPKWEGPYLVHTIKRTTYQLKRKNGTILPFKVHRNRLKKYFPKQDDYISLD